MHFEVEKNTIAKLFIDEDNIIFPWGVETADDSAFFSLEKGIGWRREILSEKYTSDNKTFNYEVTCKMNKGMWKIVGVDRIEQNSIIRKIELECLEKTLLMDFVLRFRFKKEYFDHACICGETIKHLNSNIYHQRKTDNVSLHGKRYIVNVKVENKQCSTKMQPEMYVRDSENEWVIHARMMPSVDEVKVIKLCNSWYKTKPLPDKLNTILCKSNYIYSKLKYRNERNPYKNIIMQKINPNAFPMVWLEKGTKISWDINCSIQKIDEI